MFRRNSTTPGQAAGIRGGYAYPASASAAAPAEAGARIAVLTDMDTGREFYLDILDRFEYEGRQYVAFFPMQERHFFRPPQLVILRLIQGQGEPGTTQFESVRNRRELRAVFDAFFKRYEMSVSST